MPYAILRIEWICVGDSLQLEPIHAKPLFSSEEMLVLLVVCVGFSSVEFLLLVGFVSCGDDTEFASVAVDMECLSVAV